MKPSTHALLAMLALGGSGACGSAVEAQPDGGTPNETFVDASPDALRDLLMDHATDRGVQVVDADAARDARTDAPTELGTADRTDGGRATVRVEVLTTGGFSPATVRIRRGDTVE